MRIYNKNLINNSKALRKNMTPWEVKLWLNFLQTYEYKFRRQQVIDNFIVDFYCPKVKLVIELDGGGHYEQNMVVKDQERDKHLTEMGYKVLRVPNNEIDSNFYGVCSYIDMVAKELIKQNKM